MKEIFTTDINENARYNGFVDDAFSFIEKHQLLIPELWARFVQQFREDADYDAGWRGEYWGKMMRGACLVYSYTKNEELYSILTQTVFDMINSADENGRISSYSVNHEFDGWDLWCRKYVILGMEYFLDICDDERFKDEITLSMCRQVDYIMSKIGNEEGKKQIPTATRHWRGLNSCSILEPIVKLYNLTGKQRYFDFAQYIVDFGGTDVSNLFDLAYENKLYPYQYPVTKAYEMISCFEGLIEFYKITGVERYKIAILNFADRILESDFTVIGSCGCTHELFDHSAVRQANTTNGEVMQETCVTVTLMKFMYRVHLLSGDSKYVEAFERSFYNAYLGSLNTEEIIDSVVKEKHNEMVAEPLPFDSYSPLTAGTRGNGIGGFEVMSDGHYYGCCACIGSAGIGLVPKMQLLGYSDGLAVNLYIDGDVSAITPEKNNITLHFETEYPKHGKIKIHIDIKTPEIFEIALRNPSWSKSTKVSVNDNIAKSEENYIKIKRLWENGDIIELDLDMRTEAIYPIPYGSQVLMTEVVWGKNYVVPCYDEEDPIAHKHIALRRGPIMLAQENRLGYSVDNAIDIKVDADGYVDVLLTNKDIPYNCVVKADVPLSNGGYMTVTDYSSAGKLWSEESKMAVWMLTE